MQKIPKARPGIDGLLKHPFLMFYEDNSEEVISAWVRRLMEQMRIMKRFPSDVSLASTSSSASGWSGMSGHSSKFSSTIPGQGFQYMDTS